MPQRIQVVSSVIVRSGRALLQQRDPLRSDYGWAWESAGGQVEPGETPEQALARELREELDVDALVGEELGSFSFDPDRDCKIVRACTVTFYRVTRMSGTPRARVAVGLGWFLPEEMLGLAMTPANDLFRMALGELARASGDTPQWPAGGRRETREEYERRALLGVPPEEFPEAWEQGTPEYERRLLAEAGR